MSAATLLTDPDIVILTSSSLKPNLSGLHLTRT